MTTPMEDELEGQRHYYHYFNGFPNSFALISPFEDVSTAIVFVHGFGGDAYGTWNEFHLMVDEDSWTQHFSMVDLFFFDYKGVWERIHSSTDRLLTFLDKIIFRPEPSHFSVDLAPVLVDSEEVEESTEISALPKDRQYQKVILAGHSEGGVVIRNAVDKKAGGKSLILKCDLRLFAPAIGGYAPAGLVGTLVNSPFLGGILDAVLKASPAYQDLSGKGLLNKLRSKTEKNAHRHKSEPAFRAQILWGRKDYVVNPDKYDGDQEEFEECGHTKICKPDDAYFSPLNWVSKGKSDNGSEE